MNNLSVKFLLLLALTGPILSGPSSWAADWPVNREIDLSSGFGDFRDGHFHAGIDLRTGGRIGEPVESPVAGYVWRLYMSYTGYGKGLYIMGDDGRLYVYGHLSKFSGNIGQMVRNTQSAARRYYLDIRLPRDSIRVAKGELIAYSGQTGIGAPHLHFELRSGDNVPLNPLSHGFSLADRVAPVFTRVGFQMVDDSSLFDTGRRKMFRETVATASAGQYGLDTLFYFNRPFGIIVDVYDQMRTGGMKQAVYRLRLFVDDDLRYEVRMDTLDFETTGSVRLEYDYVEAIADRKRTRRLFKQPGNDWPGSGGADLGLIGLSGSESVGRHRVRIEAEDCFGNSSQLSFPFLWGPAGDVYALDSIAELPDDITEFYFTPHASYKSLGIDSVSILRNKNERWGRPENLRVLPLAGDRLKCRVVGSGVDRVVLRLFVFTEGNGMIRDNVFNGIEKQLPDRLDIMHEVVEDGLLLTVESRNRRASETRLELYDGDVLLGVEYPRFFDIKRYICFIPPQEKYERITRIAAAQNRDLTRKASVSVDTVDIALVGHRDGQEVAVDEFMTLHVDRGNFYQPRFLELRSHSIPMRTALKINSFRYDILPPAFVCRSPFEMSLNVPSVNVSVIPCGLCWLDQDENEWVWINDTVQGNILRTGSQGGGSFAAVFDGDAPEIKSLNIHDGRTYHDFNLPVTFFIVDTLSGIGDDRDIVVKLDGQWLIPEYDPERGFCRAQPLTSLKAGKHHLGIMITDRAGNVTEQYLNFFVGTKSKKGRK